MTNIGQNNFPEVLLRYYPGGYFGYDKEGHPVYIQPLGKIDFKGLLHSVTSDDILRYKRHLCRVGHDLCARQNELFGLNLARDTTVILDLNGLSKKHFWWPGVKTYQNIVKMMELEYPRGCERALIVNAPTSFHSLFAFISPFLSRETKRRIKICGNDWRDEVRKYIHSNNLPIQYGGTCTDDYGSPKCEQFICYGGEVPKQFYVTENINKDHFEWTRIQSGKRFVIQVNVLEPNSSIKYQFITSDYDIRFSVEYSIDHNRNLVILPLERKTSHIILEEGLVRCHRLGTYFLIFDNSYSWVRSKHLLYSVELLQSFLC